MTDRELPLRTRKDLERLRRRRLEIADVVLRLWREGRTFEEAMAEAIAATPKEATWRRSPS